MARGPVHQIITVIKWIRTSRLSTKNDHPCVEREFFIDNILVRIHFITVMIWWTDLAPWGFEFPFPGSITSTFLRPACVVQGLVYGV